MSVLSFSPTQLNPGQRRKLGVAVALSALRAKGFTADETRGGLIVNGQFAHCRCRSNSDLNLAGNPKPIKTWILNNQFVNNPTPDVVLVDMENLGSVRVFRVPGSVVADKLQWIWDFARHTNSNRTTATEMRHLPMNLPEGWLEAYSL